MNLDSHHPAYFDVRFRGDPLPECWPREFAVITAYATTGEQWSATENLAADQRLTRQIRESGFWHVRLTGYSPRDGHAEPGWALQVSLDQARELGREYLQDAIYWIADDQLWVTKCGERSPLVRVGSFRERLDEPRGPVSQPVWQNPRGSRS